MALAEKLIHDLDKPRSEVVVDIIVFEASSSYLKSLTTAVASTGLNLPDVYAAPQPSGAAGRLHHLNRNHHRHYHWHHHRHYHHRYTTAGSSTTGTAIPISHIGQVNFNDFSTVLPGALFLATLSDTRTKVLHSPQLRSVDGQKATMKIGEKEPTASGSFQPGLGGVAGLASARW